MTVKEMIEITSVFDFKKKPADPAKVFKKAFLEPTGMTNMEFCNYMGWQNSLLRGLVLGMTPFSAKIAIELSRAFGTTPQFWMTLQKNKSLWDAKKKAKKVKRLKVKIGLEFKL